MAENEQNQGEKPQEAPKIIVDDDWKAQAQAEKEKLAEEVEAEGEGPDGAEASDAGQGGPRRLPPATLSTLVSSLVTQVFMALGGMEDPQTKRRYVDLDLAKHHIDTLVVLEEKTEGHLTDDERKLLDQGLYECRMQYVNIAQRVTTTSRPGGPGQ
ncbi:MAG: DUF1844 domain-containing protein [Phycisphaerae bacterium]